VISHSQRAWPIGPSHQAATVAQTSVGSQVAPDEVWHVQVAAGDVRVVTLEKLDDLYRYDAIDEQAFVWQTGMSGWVQLRTLLGIDAAPDITEPEEPFHVLFGAGNVRELTLVQLDEFYRNEIIDESTLVWTKGMTAWQSLGQVAGIDDTASVELPTVPQRPIATQPIVVPVARTQPVIVPVLTTPPVAFSIEPPLYAEAGRGWRWPFRLALAAGVALAIFRNDLAYSIVNGTALARSYTQAEASVLGGPSFGTLRSVETFIADCGGHLEPVRLPVAVTQYADAQKQFAAAAKTKSSAEASGVNPSSGSTVTSPVAEHVTGASSGTAALNQAAVASAPASGAASELGATKAKPVADLSKSVAATIGKMPVKPAASRMKASARPARKGSSSSKGGLRSGGSYFDPLNPTL